MGDDRAFCEEMLPKVSRTFALCIRLLPPKVEYPVLVSYLLCRIADTIEDTVDLSGTEKGALLAHFGSCVEESGPDAGPIGVRFERALTDEERLAHQTDAVLREFRQLPSAQRASIRPWVQEMCSGMADFAMKQGDRSVPSPSEASESRGGSTLHALATVDDLERYCYYVAGTVGHLLTGLFHTIQPGVSDRRFEQLDKLATSFGLGLQLTNIIKDVEGGVTFPASYAKTKESGPTSCTILHSSTRVAESWRSSSRKHKRISMTLWPIAPPCPGRCIGCGCSASRRCISRYGPFAWRSEIPTF